MSVPRSVVVVGVRQQRQEARALDGGVELALVVRLGAGQPGRDDLAVFLDEIAQRVEILVVDLLDAGGGEAAELAALEQRVLLVEFAFLFAFSEESHGMPLSNDRIARSDRYLSLAACRLACAGAAFRPPPDPCLPVSAGPAACAAATGSIPCAPEPGN